MFAIRHVPDVDLTVILPVDVTVDVRRKALDECAKILEAKGYRNIGTFSCLRAHPYLMYTHSLRAHCYVRTHSPSQVGGGDSGSCA